MKKMHGLDSSSVKVPEWVEILLGENFFTVCSVHSSITSTEKIKNKNKNRKNFFCLDCCTSLCSHCLSHHNRHSLLQIRRYMYQDVIRITDAKTLNCSSVDPYIANETRVVFLRPRPISSFRVSSSEKSCIKCTGILHNTDYSFCSLSCKFHHDDHGITAMGSSSTPGSASSTSVARTNNNNTNSSSSPGVDVDEGGNRRRRRKGVPQRSPLS
ncbi:hypothetical protein CsatB_004143 [Cannabis sativa]|uniref:Uncharacterized protein n=1 Tax=Cannabis sativa TaxID=3483 RepID=A0A7J6I961_CANSA|nr:protein RGF1 INDUCIBLE TRANSCRIPTION FACTOR 1-like [Cannabis sativa]KAF4404093.1 hypothetical protein G4B88_014549 [Cannabis sativa]